MGSLLKEIFAISEVTVEVPDEDMPGLQRAVLAAVKSGELPKSATKWARTADSAARAAARDQGRFKKNEPEGDGEPADEPEAPAPKKEPVAKAPAKKAPRAKAKAEPQQAPRHNDMSVASYYARARAQDKEPEAPAPAPEPKDDFPDLPAPKPASFQVGGDDAEGGYRSPFGHIGGGGSSWDNVPAWLRDPEMMPHAGGGSQRIPRSPEGGPEDVIDVPGKLPGKKPGLLHRMFGGGRR